MRRRQEAFKKDGRVLCRRPPTALKYFKHQADKKLLDPDEYERGGLYCSYVVNEYGPKGPKGHFFKVGLFVRSKSWHGDPMATFVKAFGALGRHSEYLPEELLRLSQLYQRNDRRMKKIGEADQNGSIGNQHNGDGEG